MCVCVCGFARAVLIYWPTDLLMCVRLHAAQSTSLEHPGLASLGAHALKLLTFPNLFPSLLIVVEKLDTATNVEESRGRSGFDDISLVSICHLPRCSNVEYINLLTSVLDTTISAGGKEAGLIIVFFSNNKQV